MTSPTPAPQKKASSRSKRVNVEVPEMVTEFPSGGLPGEKVQPIMYLRGRLLGKGGFAAVYELQSMSDGTVVAGKVISKETLQKARAKAKLETEIAIHRRLQHSNIVKFLRSFEDSTNVYILLECCTGRTLADLLRSKTRLTDAEAADMLLQTITAVKMLHDQRIIHRDLKLSNLFLDQAGKVKVGDFGLACQLSYDGERKTTICGTPNYIAPEVLAGKSGHSYEVDIWSLGVILYTLLIGKPPFETSDVRSTYRRIRSNAYFFPEGIPISDEGSDLIRKVLKTEPEQRPTIDEMLAHPFFTRFSSPEYNKSYASPTSMQPATVASKASSPAAKVTQGDTEPQVVHVNVWAGAPPASAKSTPPPLQVPANMPSTPEAWARYWGNSTPTGDASKTASATTPSQQQQQQYKPLERQTSSSSGGVGAGGGLGRQDSSPGGLGDSNVDTMSNCPLSPSSYMSLSRGGSGVVGGVGSGTYNPDLLNSGGKLRSRYTVNSPTATAASARRTSSLTHGTRPDWQITPSDSGGLQRSESASSAKWPPSHSSGATDLAALTGQLRSQQLDERRRGAMGISGDPMDFEYPSTPVAGARPASLSAKPPPTPVHMNGVQGDKDIGQQQAPTVAVSVRCDAATLASLEGMGFQMPSGANSALKLSPPTEEGASMRRPPLPSPVPRQGDATPMWYHQPDSSANVLKSNPPQWSLPKEETPSPKISAMPASPPISTQLNWDAVLSTSPASADPSPVAVRMQKHNSAFSAPQTGGMAAPSTLSSSPVAHRPSVWVTKWVDYSSKYGMGYVLSNGAVGVLFNDATKVVLLPDRSRYIYLEKSKGGQGGRSVREERVVLRADEEPPASLKKKATLLWYFEGYLKGANFRARSNKHPGRVSGECVGPGPVDESGAADAGAGEESTYVKKWLKTRHAIIFRLSNKVIQVDFNDETEIVLSSEMQSVTYVNKARDSTTHWLSHLPQDVELLKRLKYTKDILLQLIGGSSSSNSSSGSSASAATAPTTSSITPSGIALHY